MQPIPVILKTTRGPVPLVLQCANTPALCESGYRGLPPPADDHAGMLFFFPADIQAPFNMRGVPFDLELCVGSPSGHILGGCRMTANSPSQYMPAAKFRFAIELKAGWSERQGQPVQLTLP